MDYCPLTHGNGSDLCGPECNGCGTLDAPPRLMDADEYIAEGAQPALDIAIDQSAHKTEPVARMKQRGPEPMPGQVTLDEGRKP